MQVDESYGPWSAIHIDPGRVWRASLEQALTEMRSPTQIDGQLELSACSWNMCSIDCDALDEVDGCVPCGCSCHDKQKALVG